MKFKLKVYLVIMAFLAISCKKEADNSIVGKWDVVTHIYTIFQNEVKTSEESYNYKTGEYIIVINADGTGKFLEDGKDGVTFTWEKTGDSNYSIVQKSDPYTTITGELEIVVNKNTMTWTSTFKMNTLKLQNHIVANRM